MSPDRHRPRLAALAAGVVLALTAACGGGGTADVVLPPPPSTTSTTVPLGTSTSAAPTSTSAAPATTARPAVPTTARPGAQPAARIRWGGSTSFLSGVNVPWYTWAFAPGHGDFGGGAVDGVVAHRDVLASGFAKVRDSGTKVIRWWTFPDAAWQVQRDADDRPLRLDPAIYPDFDAAMALAEEYDLYVVFVLFSGPRQIPASWRRDAGHRRALADALGPLFARYADNPRVMAWELINEPEWEIWNSLGVVAEADVRALGAELISSVRRNAPKTLVTVGHALIGGFNDDQRSIATWLDLDLDFFAPHWYDPQSAPVTVCALCTSAPEVQTAYRDARPIVIGEFNLGLDTTQANVDRMNEWYDKGYAGAWAWSLFPEVTDDKIPIDFKALTTFNAQHPDIGPKRTG